MAGSCDAQSQDPIAGAQLAGDGVDYDLPTTPGLLSALGMRMRSSDEMHRGPKRPPAH